MNHARNQDGFALVEVIVSAAVLAIVALAVLSGIDGATASTARERARAVAASLAEQDQERMRSYRFDELTQLVGLNADDPKRNQSLTVDGVTYNVNSEVTFQADGGTTTAGCGAAEKQNDYLRIVTTVTSPIVGRRVAPVTLESLVAPPVSGSLVVKVVNAKDEPVSGVAVTSTAKSGRSYSGTTNSQGCAPFVGIESGEHRVTIFKAGYVDRTGTDRPVKLTTVTPSLVNTETFSYDVGANLTVNVKTIKPGVAWSTSATSRESKAAAVSDNTAEPNVLRTYKPAAPTSTIAVPKVFPFSTAYSFFTGTCGVQNPAVYDFDYFSKTNAAAAVIADSTKPAAQQTATVFQPALNLRIDSTSNTIPSTYKVYAHLQSSGDEACDSPVIVLSVKNWQTGTSWGNQPTGEDSRNWIVQNGTDFDPGLPFGNYRICVQNGSGNWRTTLYDNTGTHRATTTKISASSYGSKPSGC